MKEGASQREVPSLLCLGFHDCVHRDGQREALMATGVEVLESSVMTRPSYLVAAGVTRRRFLSGRYMAL